MKWDVHIYDDDGRTMSFLSVDSDVVLALIAPDLRDEDVTRIVLSQRKEATT